MSVEARTELAGAKPGLTIARSAEAIARASARARHAFLARIAILIAYVTFFGFALPDGYDTAAEDLAANHYYRAFGFFLAGLLIVLSGISNGFGRARVPASFVILGLMYGFYAVTGPLLYGNVSDIGIIEYVIAEWLTMMFLTHQALLVSEPGAEPNLNPLRTIKVLIVATFAIVLVYYLVFPKSVLSIGERFQLGGLAIHPNRLGFIGSVGILVFGIKGKTRLDFILTLLCAVVVVLAASRVGWVMGVSAVLLLMMSRYGAIVRILLGFVLAGIAIWLLYTVAVQGPGSFLDVTGNEWTTLNGRTDVWNVALQMFSMSPAIGWGFFLGPKHIGDILNQYWWHATNAQNDLLGAMVCGGYIGVLLFLIFIATLAVSFFRIKDGKDRALASGVFVLYLMSSSFEPFFVHSLGVSTVIMLLLIVQVSEWNRRSRAQSPASSGVPPQPRRPSRVP